MMEFAAGYNKVRAEQAYESIEKWRSHCAGLEAEISQLQNSRQVWKFHYAGLEAERDYLLKLLDDAYGADKNPARAHTDNELRIPSGPREGQPLQRRDVVHFKRIQAAAAKKGAIWKDWLTMVRRAKIFE